MAWPPTRHQRRLLRERFGRICAICGRIAVVLQVDHDHQRGLIRGLLCTPCNFAIGAFKDQPELLKKAAAYLASPPAWLPPRLPSYEP